MRLESRAFVGAVILTVLLLAGFRPDGLPYSNAETDYSDVALSHWPAALHLRESVLERGQFPLWQDTIMAGQPFAANPLNKTAYPLQWLALLLPPALHLNSLLLLHIALATLGMGYWSRAMGLSPAGATFAALSYGLSPRLFGHLGAGHLDIVAAMAWFPWLMLLVRRCFRQPQRLTTIVQLALVAALLFTADVRVAVFAYASAGVYALIETRYDVLGQRMWLLVPAAIGALALSAALIVPLAAWSPYLSRTTLTANDPSAAMLEPLALLAFILPGHGGKETVLYAGLPVLALALLGIRTYTPRLRWLWGGLFVFLFLYALGSNAFLWPLLTRLMPALLWFRVPARIWIIAALLLPLLAAQGLEHLMTRAAAAHDGRMGSSRQVFVVILCCGLIALLGGFALVALPLATSISLSALCGGVLLGTVLLAVLRGRLTATMAARVLLALTALDLLWTGVHLVHWKSPANWLDVQRPLAERLVSLQADRIYSPSFSLDQQVAAVYHLHLFGGVDPFQLTGIVRAVEAGSGVPSRSYEPVLPSLAGLANDEDISEANRNAVINTAVLAEWRVSHVIAGYPINNPRLQSLGQVGEVFVYANMDYISSTANSEDIPAWLEGWPDLPTSEQVADLNALTLAANGFSGAAWVAAGLFLAVGRIRRYRSSGTKGIPSLW